MHELQIKRLQDLIKDGMCTHFFCGITRGGNESSSDVSGDLENEVMCPLFEICATARQRKSWPPDKLPFVVKEAKKLLNIEKAKKLRKLVNDKKRT